MKITKDGFYKLSEIKDFKWKLSIGDNIKACIYDDLLWEKNISLEECSSLDYYSFFATSGDYNSTFTLDWDKAELGVNSLVYSWSDIIIKYMSLTEGRKDSGVLNTHILTFAWEGWKASIDGNLKISAGTAKNSGRLDEENIFLGDNASISWIPTLLVETNDVEASHACKMEKISDSELFYLRSRWIKRENALSMMIEAKVKNLYGWLEEYDKEFYEEILEKILEKIK